MKFAVAMAAAGALTLGCSSATTLRLDLEAGAGVTVQSLQLHVTTPAGAHMQSLPARLPGRVVVKFPDVAMSVDVELDGQAPDGTSLQATATVPIVPHRQAQQTLTLAGTVVAGDMAMPVGGGDDMPPPPVYDLAAPPGSDLTCTLGARCAYAFRRALTVTNGSSAALPAGYTVRVPVDATSFPPGKVLASLDDLRLFVDASGAELNRTVDLAPPGQTRAIWFALTAPIAAGASDTRYSLYYDDATAGAPPADATRVFPFVDDFNGTAIASPPWTVNPGSSPTESGGFVRLHQNTQDALASNYLTDNVPVLSALEWRSKITDPTSTSTSPGGNAYWWWAGFQRQNDFTTTDPWILWISRGSTAGDLIEESKIAGTVCANQCNGTATTTDNAYHWYRIERGAAQTRFYRDGATISTLTHVNDTDYSIMFRNFCATSDLDIDWVRARSLAAPEPTVAIGAETLVH